MVIIWTKNARNDLQNYRKNSRIFTENKLENYVTSLVEYINTLNNFNRLGKFLFSKGTYEIRQLLYKAHRIFYAINDENIFILSIIHTSKNYTDDNFDTFFIENIEG